MAQTGGSFINRRMSVTQPGESVSAREESRTVPPNLRQLAPGPVGRSPVIVDSLSQPMVAALASSVMIRPETALLMLSQRIEEFSHANSGRRVEIANSLTIALFLGGAPLLRELMQDPDSGRQLRLIWFLGGIANNGVMPRVIVARAQELLLRSEVLALLGDQRAPGRYELVNALRYIVRNPTELAPEFVGRAGAILLQLEVLGLLKNMLPSPRLAFVEMLVQMASNQLPGGESLSGQAAEALLRPEVTGLLKATEPRLRETIIEGISLVAKDGPPAASGRALDILLGPEIFGQLCDLDAFVLALTNAIQSDYTDVAERALAFLVGSGGLTHHATVGTFMKLIEVLQGVIRQDRTENLLLMATKFLETDELVSMLRRFSDFLK